MRRKRKYRKKSKRRNKKINNINPIPILLLGGIVLVFAITKNWAVTFIVLAIIILLVIYFNTPAGKGKIGELVVRLLIGRNKPKKAKYSIHNITFHDGDKSVQVDHIVINQYGIHVVETKNFAGRIYGNEYDNQWMQVLAYGRVKYKFHSPIHQNYGHILSLNNVLKLSKEDFYSYIIFTGRAKVMTEFKTDVIAPIQINKKIKNKSKKIFTKDEVELIYNKLFDIKKDNKITNKQHIRSIDERIREQT